MNPETKSRIAGALYDFMGYLTTREGDFVYGSSHECATDLLNHFTDWAFERGLSPQPLEPEIETWSLGEGMIDILLEFYSVGRLPVRAPGSGQVGTAGSSLDKGRVDTTDYTKRHKWMDAKPKGGIGSVTRFHPDDPPKQQREGLNTNNGPGAERYPPIGAVSWERKKRRKWKGGRPEFEYYGLAGLPGGVRDDPESPDSYGDFPGTDRSVL